MTHFSAFIRLKNRDFCNLMRQPWVSTPRLTRTNRGANAAPLASQRLHPRRTARRHRHHRHARRTTPARRASSKRSRKKNAMHEPPKTTGTRHTQLLRHPKPFARTSQVNSHTGVGPFNKTKPFMGRRRCTLARLDGSSVSLHGADIRMG